MLQSLYENTNNDKGNVSNVYCFIWCASWVEVMHRKRIEKRALLTFSIIQPLFLLYFVYFSKSELLKSNWPELEKWENVSDVSKKWTNVKQNNWKTVGNHKDFSNNDRNTCQWLMKAENKENHNKKTA